MDSSWYLQISEQEFTDIYWDTPVIKELKLFRKLPTSDEEVVERYMTSKLWRLNNLYGIRDKFGTPMKFNMNRSQHMVYAQSLRHARMIILKSRQQGISTFWLVSFFDDAITVDNLNIGLMAQDKDAASDLLERVDWAWDDMDPGVLEFLQVKRIVNNSKETSFSNGSKIYVRTSFRSGTLQRLHISELGKIANKYPDKAKETNSGSLQTIKAGNPVIIESTAEGRDNMFAQKWQTAETHVGEFLDLHFAPLFLSWVDDPDCVLEGDIVCAGEDEKYLGMVERDLGITLTTVQRNWAIVKRDELREEFDREYPYNPESAFAQARDGTYYGSYIKDVRDAGRIVPSLYDPDLSVVVSFDLGINDTFEMVFWQETVTHAGKPSIRLIDHYNNSGEGLSHYIGVLRSKSYRYERFVLPHDAKKRELGSASSISKQLRRLGMNKQKVLPRTEIYDGIQSVREMMPYLWIDEQCTYIIKGFENYTKEWDERLGVWKDKPRHNEWSNPMDAVRYYGVYRRPTVKKKKSKNSTNVVDKMAL